MTALKEHIILVLLVVLLALSNIFQYFNSIKSEKESTSIIESIKNEKVNEIELHLKIIDSLNHSISNNNNLIDELNNSVDSIIIIKEKTKLKYLNDIQKVKSFTALELEKYWQNEF